MGKGHKYMEKVMKREHKGSTMCNGTLKYWLICSPMYIGTEDGKMKII